jgi:hypothetical protein
MLLLVILLAVGASAGCQSTPEQEPARQEDLFVREVSEVPGFSKEELFEGAKMWVASRFSSDLDVIQYANRDLGTVVGRASFPYARPRKWGQTERFDFRFTVTVETKDERIRTTFSEMALVGFHGYDVITKEDMEALQPRLAEAIEDLASSFQRAPRQDDW